MAPSVADNPPQCNDPDEEESLHDEVTYPQLPVVINLMSSSGSDSEEEWTNGYELLPQDPENEHSSLTEQVESISTVVDAGLNHSQLNEITEQHIDGAGRDYTMDQEHIEKIKAAMVGFTLPSSSIPSWANVIPEDQWKNQLMTLMNLRKGHKGEPLNTRQGDESQSNATSPSLDLSGFLKLS